MKWLLVLCVCAGTSARPLAKTWTLDMLSKALTTCEKESHRAQCPSLADALNKIMYALYTGDDHAMVIGALPSPSGSGWWSREEVKTALASLKAGDTNYFALSDALARLDYDKKDSVQVLAPALDISTWRLEDLSEALEDPSTSKELIPFLERARMQLEEDNTSGQSMESVSIVTPVGLVSGLREPSQVLLYLEGLNRRNQS